MEVRYCGEGDRWNARANIPGGLRVELGSSAAEAVGNFLFRLKEAGTLRGVTLVENPKARVVGVAHEGQAILVAIGTNVVPKCERPKGTILARDGEADGREVSGEYRDWALDEFADMPTSSGLHVWEGRIVVADVDYPGDTSWEGAWRPATAADLARFGLPIGD